MIDAWMFFGVALAYLVFLFIVAYLGDQGKIFPKKKNGRPVVYALSIAVYCTSWTFFGSVGYASVTGYNFLPVYIGAILMIAFGQPIINHVIKLSKSQNINSIADFIAARYGKNQTLAAIITVIAVAGTLPYIALQLKAVSESVTTVLGTASASGNDIAFLCAVFMALFSILFGTRQIATTEHQDGLILAIAAESIVKLVAFLVVGAFITFYMFDGPSELFAKAAENKEVAKIFDNSFNISTWITMILLSFCAIILLPRQFHVLVVENNSRSEVRAAAWIFPLYLILINLFVIPIAIAGLLTFQGQDVNADMFVLSLPMKAEADWVTLLAFLGGLSSATAMVIMATIALSIMISNDLIVPLMLRQDDPHRVDREDLSVLLLNIRRAAIFGIFILSYLFYRMVEEEVPLASIGLLAFSAIAQFAPAFFGGMLWRRATSRGAIAGILFGFVAWFYTLLIPAFEKSSWVSKSLLEAGPWGIDFLRPAHMFNLELEWLPHGVLISLAINIIAYVTFSYLRKPTTIERLQAGAFVGDYTSLTNSQIMRLSRSSVTVDELLVTASRYLGEARAERSFREYAEKRDLKLIPHAEADIALMRFTEHLLASAIGAASSRLVLSHLLKSGNMNGSAAIRLLDEATEAIQYNRDFLQSALDQVSHGISVFDKNLRLICWNRQFRELLGLPPEMGRVGIRLDEIIRHNAERGAYGDGFVEDIVKDRINKMAVQHAAYQEEIRDTGLILQLRTNTMPQGGIVTTYADVTERIRAVEELGQAKQTLEKRVSERTAELTKVNQELAQAKSKADNANRDKTRFLAAASHDLLQPLNAARLYSSALTEKETAPEIKDLIENVDASLGAVEEILSALLDISRLDSGVMKPEIKPFPIKKLLEQLRVEFTPLAREKNLELKFHMIDANIRSDRKLVRRMLQNLISNAIKYTEAGAILVGVRERGDDIRVEVYDTGPGIPVAQQSIIFKEFERLDSNAAKARGIGLGLSIVQRIAIILKHKIEVKSSLDRGSRFSLTLPTADTVVGFEPKYQPGHVFRAQKISGTNILCIDNEPDILSGMDTLLSGWGCNVRTARSSVQAVEKALEGDIPPDIILADFHLDDEVGLDAIAAVNEALGRKIPAIIITADHSASVAEMVHKQGVKILRKPLRPAQLRALMAQSIIRGQAAE